uniref:Acetylglutamate kinase n=1 Tax=Thaumatella adunca TaxID=2006976 RepID=A0A1Z1MP36_9FLOR|nr:acetylglutamate kinase [Thaumatella adunca]ARW67514.1 acetylglutamate kinase [Thaumatella adunca]
MSNFAISDRFYFSSDTISLVNKYAGATFVIKYGGSVMKNNLLQTYVIQDLSFLYSLGIKVVLVHGGGFLINNWLRKLEIEPKFENGIRITDQESMEVVEMVLNGKINKQLVSLLNQNNIPSIGISGKDASLVQASPIFGDSNNLTGKVDSINAKILNLLMSNNYMPVIASVASDLIGNTYNINADTLASSIASELKADKLILLTDTPGILYNLNDSSSLIKYLDIETVNDLQSKGIISDGMIPKVQSCINALQSNVKAAHIIDGRLRHSLLFELFTYDRLGSMIVL